MSYIGNISIQTIKMLDIFNESITANTNILSENLSVKNQTFKSLTNYTIQGSFADEGILNILVINENGDSVSNLANGGIKQVANAAFTYTFILTDNYFLNIQYSASTTINYLVITASDGSY